MSLTKYGVVTRRITKVERPKSKPKTVKQLADDVKRRLARKVVSRVAGSDL